MFFFLNALVSDRYSVSANTHVQISEFVSRRKKWCGNFSSRYLKNPFCGVLPELKTFHFVSSDCETSNACLTTAAQIFRYLLIKCENVAI